VDLPSEQFLQLMHQHFAARRPLPSEVIDVSAQRVGPRDPVEGAPAY
jgi:hypothetical protein